MTAQWAKRQEDGSLLIAAQICEELGLRDGEAASLEIVDGELRIRPLSRTIEQVQAVFRRHVPAGVSLADELIADRRREAEAE